MRPAIEPENIFVHDYKENDVVLWYNRALWHSIMEYPDSCGPRVMHQCNIAASGRLCTLRNALSSLIRNR